MELVALLLATEYESEILLGVYSSQERAEAAAEAFLEQRSPLRRSESFVYQDVELDSAAEYHW